MSLAWVFSFLTCDAWYSLVSLVSVANVGLSSAGIGPYGVVVGFSYVGASFMENVHVFLHEYCLYCSPGTNILS